MWEYVAGLFDGDGSFSIALSRAGLQKNNGKTHVSVNFNAKITTCHLRKSKPIIDFLVNEGIISRKTKIAYRTSQNSPYQRTPTFHISINTNKGLEKFVNGIFPHVILKREQCSIMLRVFEERKKIKDRGERYIDNLEVFDDLRHALHDLSVKGPRTLKPWRR